MGKRGGGTQGQRNGKGKVAAAPSPGRRLKEQVRTAKKRRLSSTLWLERQLNDPYVAEARRLGYRSRAAFKLMQLDDRFRFLRAGACVVDLGCAPGGWLQVAVERTNALGTRRGPRGRVFGIDLQPIEPVPGAEVRVMDFLAPEAEAALSAWIERAADVVLSDMAAPATGHKPTDHLRVIALCEAAAEFAFKVLAQGGTFVAKVLDGGAEAGLQTRLKRSFAEVRNVKPPASRADSSEKYVVALGFRGAQQKDASPFPSGAEGQTAATAVEASQVARQAP